MKPILPLILLLLLAGPVLSQQSDFIVLKKKNNRTLRTYYAGAFISAVTYTGFPINGYIKDIRNDSIIIQQQERQLMAGDFGTVLDTLMYTIVVNYREIKQFNYSKSYGWGGRRGFARVALPKIMMIGGAGFVGLELVNTLYRGESFNEGNKLPALGIAAGVAFTGWMIEHMQERAKKVGKKYKVVYVKRKSS